MREQILQTATRLFAARGYEGTSLQAIADDVGIRKPSLLYHFPSKEQLRVGVVEHVLGHWQAVLPSILGTRLDGETRFDHLVGALLAFFRDDPDRARLVIRELLDRPKEMREQLAHHVRPWVVMVGDYVEMGREAGEIRPDVDPEAYVVEVLVLVLTTVAASGLLKQLIPHEPGTEDDRQDRQVREMLRIAKTSLFRDPGAAPDAGQRPRQ